jgi:hypothetical protein
MQSFFGHFLVIEFFNSHTLALIDPDWDFELHQGNR